MGLLELSLETTSRAIAGSIEQAAASVGGVT